MSQRARLYLWAGVILALAAGWVLLRNVAAGADVSAPVPGPIPSPKAIRYFWTGNVLWIVSNVWGLLVPAVIFFSGFSARLRDVARRIGRNKFGTLVVY